MHLLLLSLITCTLFTNFSNASRIKLRNKSKLHSSLRINANNQGKSIFSFTNNKNESQNENKETERTTIQVTDIDDLSKEIPLPTVELNTNDLNNNTEPLIPSAIKDDSDNLDEIKKLSEFNKEKSVVNLDSMSDLSNLNPENNDTKQIKQNTKIKQNNNNKKLNNDNKENKENKLNKENTLDKDQNNKEIKGEKDDKGIKSEKSSRQNKKNNREIKQEVKEKKQEHNERIQNLKNKKIINNEQKQQKELEKLKARKDNKKYKTKKNKAHNNEKKNKLENELKLTEREIFLNKQKERALSKKIKDSHIKVENISSKLNSLMDENQKINEHIRNENYLNTYNKKRMNNFIQKYQNKIKSLDNQLINDQKVIAKSKDADAKLSNVLNIFINQMRVLNKTVGSLKSEVAEIVNIIINHYLERI